MKRKSRKPTRKEQAFSKELEVLLGIIWCLAEDQGSYQDLAYKANVHISTINRLWWNVTKRPQMMTIQKLGDAVGLTITFAKDGEIYTSMEQEAVA